MMGDAVIVDGKRYMWDGGEYVSEAAAKARAAEYGANGFETQVMEEDGTCRVYTRRVAQVSETDEAPP